MIGEVEEADAVAHLEELLGDAVFIVGESSGTARQ
jgi:hypothetical protein